MKKEDSQPTQADIREALELFFQLPATDPVRLLVLLTWGSQRSVEDQYEKLMELFPRMQAIRDDVIEALGVLAKSDAEKIAREYSNRLEFHSTELKNATNAFRKAIKPSVLGLLFLVCAALVGTVVGGMISYHFAKAKATAAIQSEARVFYKEFVGNSTVVLPRWLVVCSGIDEDGRPTTWVEMENTVQTVMISPNKIGIYSPASPPKWMLDAFNQVRVEQAKQKMLEQSQ